MIFSFEVQYVLLLIFHPIYTLVSQRLVSVVCLYVYNECPVTQTYKADLGGALAFSFEIHVLKAAEDELFVLGHGGKQQFCTRH